MSTAYERRDADPRLIAGLLAGLAVTVALVVVALVAVYPDSLSDVAKPAPPAGPGPRLQHDPRADLAALLARQRADLDGYGWVDRDTGVVHIPIEQAMRMVAERGIPDWPTPPGGEGAR